MRRGMSNREYMQWSIYYQRQAQRRQLESAHWAKQQRRSRDRRRP